MSIRAEEEPVGRATLRLVVGLGALLAFALVAQTLLTRAAALQLPAYDTAFFEQVVWNLGQGRGFASGYFPANFLGLHFELALVFPGLLERLWPDAQLLSWLHA